MRWEFPLLPVALLALAGCDQLALGPPQAASAPVQVPPPPAAADAALRAHAGDKYADFVAGQGVRFGPDGLGLSNSDGARLLRNMAQEGNGALISGGSAEALVFRGCAATGCSDGVGIVAIDTTTGAAFAGVRDNSGSEVLTPNERVEALLRLSSPTRAWDNPRPIEQQRAEAQP